MSATNQNVYYSPVNTSDNSYVILPEDFIPTSQVPGRGGVGGREAPPFPVPSRKIQVLIGIILGAALLDIVVNRGPTLHKELGKTIGGSAAVDAVKTAARVS